MPEIHIHWMAVLVAALVGYFLGALWYSKVLFGKPWLALMGFTPEKMEECKKKGLAKNYVAMLVGKLLMAFVLAHVIAYSAAHSLFAGASVGFWCWLGFVAPVMLGSVLWEGKPVKLYVLNTGYYLAALVLMGAIFGIWS